MSSPDPNRPQPVADTAQRVGQLVFGAFTAVGIAWFLLAGGLSQDNLNIVGAAVGAAVTALIGLGAYLWSLWKGRQVAAKVTPLSDPRNGALEPLKTAAEWAAEAERYGQHAGSSGSAPAVPVPIASVDNVRYEVEPVDLWRLPVPSLMLAHPEKKLGKLPPIPGRAAVPFRDFVQAVPEHPVADPAPQLAWPMDRNDQAGDCVVAGLDHTLQTICAQLGVPRQNWTDDQLLAFYQTQNPNFRSWADAGNEAVDGGMVIQTFLEYLVAQKVILAFGKVDHSDPEEMRAATYLGLAIVTGEILDLAQQTQTVWSYQQNSPNWGGHCTCTVGYPGSTRQTCVTWGGLVDMTESFIAHQLDEAWFVLTQAHVDHAAFRQHFDLAGFAAAVAQITGGKVVVPVPAPQPPPAPAPGPAPVGPPAELVSKLDGLMARIEKRRNSPREDVDVAQAWLEWEKTQ